MMSSTWKISVFGIVALMLSFGLVAGDAFAHTDGHSSHPRTNVRHFSDANITVGVESTVDSGGAVERVGDDLFGIGETLMLRANEKLDTVVVTYKHVSDTDWQKKGTVTLTIPRTWTRAVRDNDDGVDEPGEITVGGADSYSVTSGGGGWQIKANFTSDPPHTDAVIYYKKVTVPNRAGRYEFGISSTTVGDGHSSALDPHSTNHAVQAEDPEEPPAGYHKHSGATAFRVEVHDHTTDFSHEHEGGDGHLIVVEGHDHAADKTHDHDDDKVVLSVDGHSHPFNDGIGAHVHNDDNGYVNTRSGHDDLHTHSTGSNAAYTDTHTHDENGDVGTVAGNHDHGTPTDITGETQHDHDDDDTVSAVAAHKHPADSITNHVHATTGRRGINQLATDDHGTDANAHTHHITSGLVLRGHHTHSGHTGDHSHPDVDSDPATADPAALPASTAHNENTHTHTRAGDIAGVSGHTHPDTEDGGFRGHEHDDDSDADITTVVSHNTILHSHVSEGGLITSVRKGHTHTPGRGYTRLHQHSAAGSEPEARTGSAVTAVGDHKVTNAGHNAFYFRSEDTATPVHTHSGSTVTWPDETSDTWSDLAGRIADYNIAYHTHDSAGNIGTVTAHTHALNTEIIDVTVIDHQHQAGSSATRATGLLHGEISAMDFVVVAEHTHTGSGLTVDAVAHRHQSGGTPETDGGFTHSGADANSLIAIMSQHSHSGTKTNVVVIHHKHVDNAESGEIYSVTAHYHGSGEAVEPLVDAHSHVGGGTTGAVRNFAAPTDSHTHSDVADHTHIEDDYTVVGFDYHTHHSSTGHVVNVRAHTHGASGPEQDVTGVLPTEPHLHAVEHNGKYAVHVGSVLSGSGSVTLSNTGSPKLAARGDAPYKGKYLATKGQALGNVRVTFEAKGTMVKGAGIKIQLPIYDESHFPRFYPDNQSGPAGGVSLADSRSRSLAEFSAFPDAFGETDDDGISTNIIYLTTKTGLEDGSRIAVNIRGVTLKAHGDPPDKDPTAEVGEFAINASTASPLVTPNPDEGIHLPNFEPLDSPTLAITALHGSGTMAVDARDPLDALNQAGKGEDIANLVLTYTADGGALGIGGKVEVTIPGAFAAVPFEPANADDDRSGAVTLESLGRASLSVAGRVLTAELTEALPHGEQLQFTYKGVKAPDAEGAYTFRVRSSSGPHGTLTALADDQQKVLEVTGAHGSGTVSLTRGGRMFRQAAKEQQLGNLTFTYIAGGRMSKGAIVQVTIPEGWNSPHEDNGDGVSTAGEVKLTGKADLAITGRPWKLTATTSDVLSAGDKLVITYKSVQAPAAPGSYTFETSAIAFDGALTIDDPGARLDSSPTVGIDQAPDGSGTLSVSKSTAPALTKDATGAYLANAGESLGNLTFTYSATGKMEIGSTVEVTIPGSEDDWPSPSIEDDNGITEPGESAVAGAGAAGLGISGRTLIATITVELQSGNTFTITYKGVNAPTTVGEYDFTTQSKSTTGGTPTNLTAGSPTIKVGQVPVGVVSISTTAADGTSSPLTSAGPGASLGNVTLTFTATARMSAGATVMITVPAGWTAPNVDNNDGVDGAGEVSLTGSAGLQVTGGGGQPWQLVATTGAVLASGDTLVFTYKSVTAPSTEGSYTFTTVASISAESTTVPIAAQPTPIIVRSMVTAIAIAADASFFAGESVSGMVTLWSGTSAANALGDVVVTLTTDSETGSFAADSITIADNMPGAAFTYNDTAPGAVTLTATSGEMTATHAVAVKSGVAGLRVTPDLVKAGSDVTVTATGKAGGGTVKVMDAEAMQVGTTKSLDPIDEPEDGDVTYSRTITLPADLADGTYTVTVDIQDLTDTRDIEVLNDQAPPTLSGATASPMTVVNGDLVTLSVMAASTIDITSVMADLSAVDSTQTEMVSLTQQGDGGTYFYVFTISTDNTNDDGEATITITATDRIKNAGTAMVSVTLDNVKVTLDSVSVEPDMPYEPGETAWIKATGSAGGEVSATVNNSETGMMIAQVTLEEMEGTPGSYVAGLTIVEDAHPEGMYDVTVTLGDQSMTAEGALTIVAAPSMPMFSLSIPAGTHLIHVPLDVTQIDGMDATIDTVGDLYDALGDAVNFIISLGADGSWNSYLGDNSAGTVADAAIGDDTGLIAVMSSAATLNLTGNALGTGGVATITLGAGRNLVGLPLHSAQISMISDVVASPLVSAVVVSNAAGDGFKTIVQLGDPGDGAPMGGQGYIVVAAAAASIPVIGMAWDSSEMMADMNGGMTANGNGMAANGNGAAANGNGASAAPSIGFRTPVLQVQGMLIDEAGMVSRDGLSVSVKNLSSGSVLGRTSATDAYSMTFVKLDSSAAKVGDVLEIRADSPNPLLGIRPVQHVVTSEDVLNNRVSLPDLVTYEIPALTELLANYPNPFNPETWVPFRLAEDANVSLTIYGASGSLVRTIDIGFTPAAVYQGRSDAIYWDGRNNFGEQVSSGIYFYHLNAGDFSATRKMVIVK